MDGLEDRHVPIGLSRATHSKGARDVAQRPLGRGGEGCGVDVAAEAVFQRSGGDRADAGGAGTLAGVAEDRIVVGALRDLYRESGLIDRDTVHIPAAYQVVE